LKLPDFRLLLFKFHLINFPVEELYGAFMCGEISERTLFRCLRPRQIQDFIDFHARIKRSFEDKVVDPALLALLPTVLTADPRRLYFAITQMDHLIEKKDLAKEVHRLRGDRNVIRRDD